MSSASKTNSDEAAIRAQIAARVTAVRSKNVEAVLACYAQDVATFDLVAPLANMGLDAVRVRLSDWFASFETPIDYQVRDVKLALSGDVAFDCHFTHVRGTNKSGQQIAMWFRETIGYQRIGGTWKVTHQHSSVPLDMNSTQARLDLQP
jgi:ketosteroid isomerase-like protein